MGRKQHPSRSGDEDRDPEDQSPEEEGEIELPDIRIVTLTYEVGDDGSGDVQVGMEGIGFYEGVGLLACGLFKVLMSPYEDLFDAGFLDEPDDEDLGD
jgi:hypothetical protein